VSPPAHAAAGFTRKIARRILALGMVEQSVCRQVSKERRYTPAGFSLVFAPHGGPQMVWLSFQHSLGRLTQPVERSGQPSLLEASLKMNRNNVEAPVPDRPNITATPAHGFGFLVHADVLSGR